MNIQDNVTPFETESLLVRMIRLHDELRWRELFRAYREFYELEESEEVVSRAWGWFMDPHHECKALVAELDGEVVGFAHHRRMSSPYVGSTGIFLDDLFSDPTARGKGVGRSLIQRLTEMAEAEGRTFVQWMTATDNHRAQALYEKVATKTDWLTYEISLQSS